MRVFTASRVFRNRRVLTVLLFSCLTPPTPMSAQSILDREVSISVVDRPLREVLELLGSSAGIGIAYADETIDSLQASLTSEGRSVAALLDELLRPFGLDWEEVAGRVVVRSPVGSRGGRMIRGRVQDARSGVGLPTVRVRSGTASTLSDGSGGFTLRVQPGDLVHAHLIGYESSAVRFDDESPMALTLEPLAIGLAGIRIEAEAPMLGRGLRGETRVRSDLVDAVPPTGEADLFRALESLAGVSVGADANAGLFVRGAPPDQHLIRYDDATIYHSGHLFGFFSPLNPDAVQRVDLYKSAFPSSFGERSGSVFDIRSDGTDRSNRTRLRLSPLSSSATIHRTLGSALRIRAAVRGGWTQAWPAPLRESLLDVSAPETDREALDERSFGFFDAHASLRWSRGKDAVRATAFTAGDRFDQRLDFEESGVFESDELGTDRTSSFGSVGWTRDWMGGLSSDLVGTASWYENRVANVFESEDAAETTGFEFRERVNRVSEQSARLTVSHSDGSEHHVRVGLGVTRIDVRLAEAEETSEGRQPESVLDRQDDRIVSLFANDRWRLSRSVDVRVGLRAAHSSALEQVVWSPAAGVDWSPTAGLRIGAAGGRYHQWVGQATEETLFGVPVAAWLLTDDGTRSDHATVDVEWSGKVLGIRASGFLRESEGIGDFTDARGAVTPLFDFDGRARVRGWEGSIRWLHGPTTVRVNYATARVRHTFDAVDDGTEFPATHDRPHTGEVVFELRAGGWRFGAFGVARSGRPFTPVVRIDTGPDGEDEVVEGPRNSARLAPYARLDLSASYSAPYRGRSWTLTASVYNVLDRENPWYRRFGVDDGRLTATDIPQLGLLPSLTFRLDLP